MDLETPSDEVVMHFSRDDTVERLDNPDMVGTIVKVGGHSDTSEDEEDSDVEEQEIEEGLAQVSWNNADRTVEELCKLRVVDRPFRHGDIVALSSDPVGQTGIVSGVQVLVDLEYPNGEVVKNIDAKLLRRVHPVMVDDYVVRDYWVGKVEEVEENVTVLFDDGAMCRVRRAEPGKLYPAAVSLDNDWEMRYYPGLRVRSGTSSLLFKHSKWLRGCWKPSRMEGTVSRVDIDSISVYWIGAGNAATEKAPPVPAEQQDPKDVDRLENNSYLLWQIGDRSLPPKLHNREPRSDGETSVEEASHEEAAETEKAVSHGEPEPKAAARSPMQEPELPNVHVRKHRRCALKREKRKSKAKQPPETAVLVTRTRRMVDVVWQDATTSLGLLASSLIQVRYPGENDFWPEYHVVEKVSDESSQGRTGIVKSVDAKQRTARVHWFKQAESQQESPQFESEEVVSVYELIEHPDFNYRLGDVVILLHPVGKEDESAEKSEPESHPDVATTSRTKRTKMEDLSFTGIIVGLQDGNINVRWGNGVVSKVGPQSIFILNRDDDDDSDDDEDDDAGSWETVDETSDIELPDELPGVEADEEKTATAPDGDNAGGLLLSTAVSILSKFVRAWIIQAKKAAVGEPSLQTDPENSDKVQDKQEESESMEGEELSLEIKEGAACGMSASGFRHFDSVKDPSDHFYCEEPSQATIPRKWLKKVQAEWSILQNNLPETIFVRIYEDRMDLLRAVIVGAAGTPYHDGIFVFDFFLPPDYPTVPPTVYYHSGGLRLNPNLYENGKVCLSLLNTWSGKGTELWRPGTSNILQVLVSIQGLVLNAKPYFNEAGYERQSGTGEGEKNSIAYNENTFLLSIKSMLYVIRRPPMHFEGFVTDHFRSRAAKFLACCKHYLEGVPVGYLTGDGEKPAELTMEGSGGFKIMLAKLLPRLAAAFAEIGAPGCQELVSKCEQVTSSEDSAR